MNTNELLYTEADALAIAKLAQGLIDQYPGSLFCSLGQSPSLIVSMIENITAIQKTLIALFPPSRE